MKQIIVQTGDEKVKNRAKMLGLPLFEEVEDMTLVQIRNKEDEEKALKMAPCKHLLLEFPQQEIIPLENVIAEMKGKTEILVKVNTANKAKMAMETLELGADGVVLETEDISQLEKTVEAIAPRDEVVLEEATVTAIRDLGLGARACIDTCEIMERGKGMLVGTSSKGMILIQAEVEQNPFVSARPFRVNAGAVSLYVLVPNNKTRYLEEIMAGDEVLIVNKDGKTNTTNVARSKIEMRPLILIEAENEGHEAKALLQKAETVRVVTPSGGMPVTDIKVGDRIIARFEEGGRHFGTLVKEEMVIEK
ncbi:MAG: 3-dehydroquinate synthase II [Candidatus Methanofastidiosia archaeon]